MGGCCVKMALSVEGRVYRVFGFLSVLPGGCQKRDKRTERFPLSYTQGSNCLDAETHSPMENTLELKGLQRGKMKLRRMLTLVWFCPPWEFV